MEHRYCPSCGTDVPLERTLESGYVMISCSLCGLGLGVRPATASEVHELKGGPTPEGRLARVGVVKREQRISAVVERSAIGKPVEDPRTEVADAGTDPPARQMRQVFLVEDSSFLRELTRDLLTERQLAKEVADFPDGPAFIEAFARAVAHGDKPDLVVLDVRMPGMDGIEAAYALRAIEAACKARRTPILFFSGVLCDEAFKQSLLELGNARYIRKADSDVQRLGERIAMVLAKLLGATE